MYPLPGQTFHMHNENNIHLMSRLNSVNRGFEEKPQASLKINQI